MKMVSNVLSAIYLAAAFIGVISNVGLNAKEAMDSLNRQAVEETLNPVRPGIPGQRPFWNRYALRFIYAPAFDFREIKGAAIYQFTALSFADRETYRFEASHPWEPLTAIWERLPVGEVFLKVEGLDAAGSNLGLSGERKFYRAAPFHGPYPSPETNYKEAARRQLDYIFQQEHVQNWSNHYEPDPDYELNAYTSKMVQATITAMLKYAELHGSDQPEKAATAMRIARNAADFLIEISEPADAPLPFLPPTYTGNRLAARANQEKLMVNICAGVGQTYLNLFEATGESQYQEAAKRIAQTLLTIQLPSGSWPIKMRTDTGEQDTANFGIPLGIIQFLIRMESFHNDARYAVATSKAWNWILENPLKTFNWEGQFEDVQPSEEAYQLMGMHDPCSVALYLLKHRDEDASYLDTALEIIWFVEDQFVVWERPLPYAQRMEPTTTWFTPSVLEQYTCYTPIDASVSRVAATFFEAYKATGDELFLLKSRTLADSLVRQQGPDGNIPTGWDTVPPTRIRFWWLNCAVGDALFLLNYDPQ